MTEPQDPALRGDARRLAALVGLLADASEAVRTGAIAALRSSGADAGHLRTLVEAIDDPGPRARARARLEELRTDMLEAELRELVTSGRPCLEGGAFLLARFHHPDLDPGTYVEALDAMGHELAPRLAALPPSEGARELRRYLHDERGFRGNVESYDDPENVFLSSVLDRRKGIPTSLGCVYLLLGRRVGAPLEGINLPLHFLVRWAGEGAETFIDAFGGGRFLTRADCREFLREAGLAARPEFLGRASDRAVLTRLVRCLVACFRACGATRAAERYSRCLAIVGAREDDR